MVRAATRAETPRYRALSRSVRQRLALYPGGPERELWVPLALDRQRGPLARDSAAAPSLWEIVRKGVSRVTAEIGACNGYPAEQWVVQVIGSRRLTGAEARTGACDYVQGLLPFLDVPLTLGQRPDDSLSETRPSVPSQRDASQRPETRSIGDVPRGTHPPVVYVLRNGTRVKIGTTTHLRNRVHRLALRLDDVVFAMEGGRELEQALHQRFASQRVGDTEWFTETGGLAAFIAAHSGETHRGETGASQ
jgi:Meiotically Up-regulated Gene 113 (MUG113) protein